MNAVERWLAPARDYLATDLFVSVVHGMAQTGPGRDDGQAYLRELLVPVEYHCAATRSWTRFFLDGERPEEVKLSPRATVMTRLGELKGFEKVPGDISSSLAQAFLRLKMLEPAELCAAVGYLAANRAPALLGLLLGKALRDKNSVIGRELVNELEARYPDGAETRFANARLLMASGRANDAEAALGSLTDRFPGYLPGWLMWGDYLLAADERAKALRWFRRGCAMNHEEPELHERLADVYVAAGDKGNTVKALARCYELLENNGDATVDRITGAAARLARLKFESGDPKGAMSTIRDEMAKRGRSIPLFLLAGEIMNELGTHDKALQLLADALEFKPGDLDLLSLMGRTLALAGRDIEAFNLLQQVAEIDPARTENLLEMARIAMNHNETVTAVELAEAVANSDPSNRAGALCLLGEIKAKSGDGPSALEYFSRALGTSPLPEKVRNKVVDARKKVKA